MTAAPNLKIVESGEVHKRRQPFGMVFEALLHDLKISDGAIRLYAHMHWRYGSSHQMYESIGTMAEAMGVTDKVIKSRVAELAAACWIVVIARRTPKGKVTSNFYHIFERPRDARAYRKSYKRVDGEYLLPAPTVEARKTRKGVGGAKYHKPKGTQVSTDGNGVSVGTQVPAEGDTQVPTIYTQVIENEKIAADAAQPIEPLAETNVVELPVVPKKPIFDAIALGSFGIRDSSKIGKDGGRIGKLEAWVKANYPGANDKTLAAFYVWYDDENDGASRPRDLGKFSEWFIKFHEYRTAQKANEQKAEEKQADAMALWEYERSLIEGRSA
jgi:hypothetical protein